MENLVVVTQAGDWPSDLPGARVVTARAYLTEREFGNLRNARVFNLCRHYRYQAFGYYVSLLAEARGHRPIPTVITMQDLRSPAVVRVASDELEDRMKRSLARIADERFTLPVYFGRTPSASTSGSPRRSSSSTPRPSCGRLRPHDGEWELQRVTAVPTSAIADEDRELAFDAPAAFFARRFRPARARAVALRPGHRLRPGATPPRRRTRRPSRSSSTPPTASTSRPRSSSGTTTDAARVRRRSSSAPHRGQPLHLPLRAPGRRRGDGGDRRPELDPALHQQGLPGRAAGPPRHPGARAP
jgi:hypothetical protein